MEKLFYALWPPQRVATPAWSARLMALPAELETLGCRRIRLGLPDVPLPRDDPYAAMRDGAPSGFVSFWLESAYARSPAEALLHGLEAQIAGFAVAESTILPNRDPAAGRREDGFLQVCGFAALPGLSRAAFHAFWLDQHTSVAVQTQATVFYNQNIVTRPLTAGAPAWDAIVEERFPPEALNDRGAYFAAGNDPARLEVNMARMAESCARFIDFSRLRLMNCGEYRFGGGADL